MPSHKSVEIVGKEIEQQGAWPTTAEKDIV